jgi:hypothetical protein
MKEIIKRNHNLFNYDFNMIDKIIEMIVHLILREFGT